MIKDIKMLYVDDLPDPEISRCLDEYENDRIKINYMEIEFDDTYNYKKLIKEIENNNINLLIIDSALYLESESRERFTGEQFKIILKKILPFIETIVISQNKQENDYDIIKKYNKENIKETIDEYYKDVLNNVITKKINEILMTREILSKFKEEKTIDELLIEKISLSLEGAEVYSELNIKDINKLIEEFKELKQVIING